MQKKKRKVFGANNSNSNTKVHTTQQNPMVKALQRAHTMGGTISYHFISERIKFSKENPDGEAYQVKSVLSSNINPAIFSKIAEGRSVRRSYEEIITMFQEITRDIGASYFEIG